MRSRLLSVLLTCVAGLSILSANAQCGGGPRYVDSIFASYTISTVTYSTVYNLQMDIYQPVGDTQSLRPVVVLAHGGSFTSGDRTDDNTITQLCADLAHKGYVTISIDYRLIDNQVELLNADTAIAEVLEAVGDGKAAVRYLYKDVLTNGNTFKIDTNNLFIGGNSAGAVLFDQYAYVTNFNQLSSQFQQVINSNLGGTLDGISGNAGYSSNFKGVINLAGALHVPEWVENCTKPIVSAQGTADPIVPYDCGYPEYGAVPVTLCGLDSMLPYITATSSYSRYMTFAGAGHVPWQTNNTDFYMIDTMITTFLNQALCMPAIPSCVTILSGIVQVSYGPKITLYPNPASNQLNIESSQFINDISVSDETGRTVVLVNGINTLNYELNTSRLNPGVYIVRINDSEGLVPSIRKIVIE